MQLSGRQFFFFFFCFLAPFVAMSQGKISGDIEIYQNFYLLDTVVLGPEANVPPQYKRQLSSTEGWLTVNYTDKDFSAGVRFDLFNNSGLRNPRTAFSGQGLGFWFVRKKIEKLDVTLGYFYDQIGSGIIFRAYEGRGQNLDYAMQGIRLKYDFSDQWRIKAFTGKQKFQFGTYSDIIKGINLEGSVKLGKHLNIQPGFGVVNRTLDDNSLNTVVNNINNLPVSDRFVPMANTWAYTAYAAFNYKRFTMNVEYAGKTREAGYDATSRLVNRDGQVLYGSLTYSQPGFGASVQYKSTDFFDFRVNPSETLNNGLVNFIPPSVKMNTWRLTSRYAPATQLVGERGLMADVVMTVAKKHTIQINYSDVVRPNGERLYQEFNIEGKFKISQSFIATAGLQRQIYNQTVYEGKANSIVHTWTPFTEFVYKINRKKSLRMEFSHMSTHEDLGSWLWGLVEYNVAPRFSLSVMDMWNYGNKEEDRRVHYWTVFGAVNFGRSRLTAGYVRQVQGVICTGGVCRVEPAFNGFRFTLVSTF